MRALGLLLIGGCAPDRSGPPLPLDLAFDTAVANVGRAWTDGADPDGYEVRWGLDPDHLDRVGRPVPGVAEARLVGLPQGGRVYVAATDGPGRSAVHALDVPITGVPDLDLPTADAGTALGEGYLLGAWIGDPLAGFGIWDGAGRLVWGWSSSTELVAAPRVALDGTAVLALITSRDLEGDEGGAIRRFPLDGSPPTETRALYGHHTFVEEPGRLLYLARRFTAQDGAAFGLDPGEITVMSDVLRATPEGGTDGGEVVWDLLDHQAPYRPCGHFDHAATRYGIEGVHDWSHSNSLVPDGEGGLLLGSRHQDSLWSLATDGSVQWVARAADTDLVMDDPPAHAHFSEADPGRVLLFDNGNHRSPEATRLRELALDPAGGVATTTWSMPQPGAGFTSWLGDVRTLPNGNLLVALTEVGRFLELTPDGRIVWEGVAGGSVGRVRYLPSLEEPPRG